MASSISSNLSSRPLLCIEDDRHLFVNRDQELSEIESAIAHEYNVLLVGTQGVGKTTLINRLLSSDRSRGTFVFNAMSTLTNSSNDIIDSLLVSLAEYAQEKSMVEELSHVLSKAISTLRLADFTDSQGVNTRTTPIERKYAALVKLTNATSAVSSENSPITFVLDNLPAVPKLYQEFFGQYRDLLWEMKCNFLVTCDQSIMSQVWVHMVSSFFDVKIRIGPLSKQSMLKMLHIRGFDPGEHIDALYWLSNGIPDRALNFARRVAVGQVTLEHLAVVVARRKALKKELSQSENEVLSLLDDYEDGVSASDESLQEKMRLTRGRLAQVLKKLKDDGYLVKHVEGRETLYQLSEELALRNIEP